MAIFSTVFLNIMCNVMWEVMYIVTLLFLVLMYAGRPADDGDIGGIIVDVGTICRICAMYDGSNAMQ